MQFSKNWLKDFIDLDLSTEEICYQLTMAGIEVDNFENVKSAMDKINVVPNPYVVTNALEQLDLQNPLDRGPRRIYFNHLPRDCKIYIYTISGSLVTTLHHNSAIDDGIEYWDLTTKDNFPVSFGVYIYHVDAGSLGKKVGRFALIK